MPTESGSGPLFVVGIWRSGTSLLYTLLNQHPQIALMYEGDLPLLRPLFRKGDGKLHWLERWEFWNSAPSRHHIDCSKIPDNITDLRTAALAVWKQYAGLAIMGDKSPTYYDSLPTLAEEFPDARFIVIWRDLADICRSMINARKSASFFAKRGTLHRAVIGYHKLKVGCEALQKQGIPLHQIQYEEMVQSPAEVMAGVCRFLQIPYDSRMSSLEGADRSAIYQESHHQHVKGNEILNGRKRKEVLPPRLKRKIDSYVRYWKEQYGGTWPLYPKSCESDSHQPSHVQRAWDEVVFRLFRLVDQFTVLVYSHAPLALLQSYRNLKNRGYRQPEAAPKAAALRESSTVETLR